MNKYQNPQSGMSTVGSLFLVIVLLLIAGALYGYGVSMQTDGPEMDDMPDEVATSTMEAFNSNQYDFSLDYPAGDWSVSSDLSFPASPKFNFYIKPAGVPLDLPLDHFANVSHVSVYPQGIPTEGVFGETRPLDFDPGMAVTDDSRMHVLADGTPFAAYIQPANPPESWNDSGFIWMRLRIDDLVTECLREGEEVDEMECDPLTSDDQIIRFGSVDQSLWPVAQDIVRSLNFR